MQVKQLILPPGFEKTGYTIQRDSCYLNRNFIPREGYTECLLEYQIKEISCGRPVVRGDYERMKELGPVEMEVGFWFLEGKGQILLTAPHAQGPRDDTNVGNLIMSLHEKTNVPALLSTITRLIVDYNNYYTISQYTGDEIYEKIAFYKKINEMMLGESHNHMKCFLDIHSMKSRSDGEIELGTVFDSTAPIEYILYLQGIFESKGFSVIKNKRWYGGAIVSHFGQKKNVCCVQVEICKDIILEPTIKDAFEEIVKFTNSTTDLILDKSKNVGNHTWPLP